MNRKPSHIPHISIYFHVFPCLFSCFLSHRWIFVFSFSAFLNHFHDFSSHYFLISFHRFSIFPIDRVHFHAFSYDSRVYFLCMTIFFVDHIPSHYFYFESFLLEFSFLFPYLLFRCFHVPSSYVSLYSFQCISILHIGHIVLSSYVLSVL